MKNAILKAVVACTMALLLFFSGISVIETANSGTAVCHDGPHKEVHYY